MLTTLSVSGFSDVFQIIFLPSSLVYHHRPSIYSFTMPFQNIQFQLFWLSGSLLQILRGRNNTCVTHIHTHTHRANIQKRRPSARLLFNVGPGAILRDIFYDHPCLMQPAYIRCGEKRPFLSDVFL